jgi:hypothetical protein
MLSALRLILTITNQIDKSSLINTSLRYTHPHLLIVLLQIKGGEL